MNLKGSKTEKNPNTIVAGMSIQKDALAEALTTEST